jgi:hypothetical protein
VLIADVSGYTRLMEHAEEETHRRLTLINQTIVLLDVRRGDCLPSGGSRCTSAI